tara:strand:+ start:244 stop:483 length:240 start_codon:yes stop_codon:yes gene_type:complete
MKEFFETIGVLLAAFACIALFFTCLGIFVVSPLGHKECKETAAKMEREYDYAFWSGCLMMDNENQLIPSTQIISDVTTK